MSLKSTTDPLVWEKLMLFGVLLYDFWNLSSGSYFYFSSSQTSSLSNPFHSHSEFWAWKAFIKHFFTQLRLFTSCRPLLFKNSTWLSDWCDYFHKFSANNCGKVKKCLRQARLRTSAWCWKYLCPISHATDPNRQLTSDFVPLRTAPAILYGRRSKAS